MGTTSPMKPQTTTSFVLLVEEGWKAKVFCHPPEPVYRNCSPWIFTARERKRHRPPPPTTTASRDLQQEVHTTVVSMPVDRTGQRCSVKRSRKHTPPDALLVRATVGENRLEYSSAVHQQSRRTYKRLLLRSPHSISSLRNTLTGGRASAS